MIRSFSKYVAQSLAEYIHLNSQSGSINVQHNAKAKTPLSVYGCTGAFLACIYLEKFPFVAPHFLKYLQSKTL